MDKPFPLHKLPGLVFRDVADYWSPFELYNYSTISKKSKANARFVGKKAEEIMLTNNEHYTVFIDFPIRAFRWKVVILKHLQPYNKFENGYQSIFMFDESPASKVLEVLEHVTCIFKLNVIKLDLDMCASNPADFPLMWKGVMNGPSAIDQVEICYNNVDDLEFIFENYTKKTKTFTLNSDCNPQQPCELPKNLKFCMAYSTYLEKLNCFMFDIVMSIDTPIIFGSYCDATAEEMNGFLKSWQAGLSDSTLKIAWFELENDLNLEQVLEGIEVTYRDSRTVKRHTIQYNTSFWIIGGIDISLHDGRTATIQFEHYEMTEENSKIPNEWIQEYENSKNGDGFKVVNRFTKEYSIFVW